MNPNVECGTCLTHWIYGRSSTGLPESRRLALLEAVADEMARRVAPDQNLGSVSNRCTDVAFRQAPGARGQYRDAKAASNRAAVDLLSEASSYVDAGRTPREKLVRACAVAALANIAPLGVPDGPFAFEELRGLLSAGRPEPVFAGDPFAVAARAREVLYVADNAGEVALDSLLIRELKALGARVTLVVKELDFFEDATADDARAGGLSLVADEILSVDGFLAPADAVGAVAEALASADLVVAKGTGSFEALYGDIGGRAGIFLLKVKCGPISRELGIGKGNFAVVATG
ncbi:MAG: DUF89 family protein [Deltaproteobacteria bacterium]|nr:DUF89 family protein [Deltaproteobacteria bacterium]